MTVHQRPARLSNDRSWSRHEQEHGETWTRAEHFLAFAGTVLIAMRIEVTGHLLTLGDLLVVATFPLWFPRMGRYIATRAWLLIGLLCIPFGLMLTVLNAVDHHTRLGTSMTASALMISLLFSVGFMLWAREKLSSGGLVASFGLGLFISISSSTALYSTNPWKFGFVLPVTILALGLTEMSKHRWLEFVVVVALCIVCGLTDARSAFAMFLLTVVLVAWQMLPRVNTRRGSAFRAIVGIAVIAAVIYNLGQALILEGILGEKTQYRTAQQISRSGSLILGGRPEIAATINLMRVHPLGFGSGTIPNYDDVQVAKEGMAVIGYDPNNGYVERWMFGHGYAMHSGFGDFWATYGPIGIIFTLFSLVLVLRKLGTALTSRTASAVLIFSSALSAWNVFFAPSYSGLKILILVLALSFMPRPGPGDPPTQLRRREQPALSREAGTPDEPRH